MQFPKRLNGHEVHVPLELTTFGAQMRSVEERLLAKPFLKSTRTRVVNVSSKESSWSVAVFQAGSEDLELIRPRAEAKLQPPGSPNLLNNLPPNQPIFTPAMRLFLAFARMYG